MLRGARWLRIVLVVLLVLGAGAGALSLEAEVLVDEELAGAGIAGGEDGEADDNSCKGIERMSEGAASQDTHPHTPSLSSSLALLLSLSFPLSRVSPHLQEKRRESQGGGKRGAVPRGHSSAGMFLSLRNRWETVWPVEKRSSGVSLCVSMGGP